MTLRVGVDTGGTFTDVCLYDRRSGELTVLKTPSTPEDPGEAVVLGTSEAVGSAGGQFEDIEYFAHGTTVATNTLLQNNGAKVALFVTSGFRDLLEIGRQRRPKLYDLFEQKPALLVPRHLIFEVDERIRYDGTVATALDPTALEQLIDANREALSEVDAIAVCYLYSFENRDHEHATGKTLQAHFPDAFVTTSSDVLPQFREFERLSTTAVNAYIGPIMQNYLRSLRTKLKQQGLRDTPKVTQSNGGVISFPTAETMPVRTVLSGPSTGVVGAGELATKSGYANVITLDVGGTSSDLALVNEGAPTFTGGMELDGRPIRAPMLDISTVGSGGGSIAWIDSGGHLKVGPHSAGAVPGPACYGNGGKDATVTDANVVLGILNNDALLGGKMPIQASLAFDAIETLGRELGLGIEETAQGIVSVVTANMAKAIRVISVQKGYDPSDYALIAFGGAGPLHSGRLARELGMKTTLVPAAPGAMSAVGMLMTNLKTDFVSTSRTLLDPAAETRIRQVYEELSEKAEAWFRDETIHSQDRDLVHYAELRYRGQNYELSVQVDDALNADGLAGALKSKFTERHANLYGYTNDESEVEIVNFRVQAVGNVDKISVKPHFATNDVPSDRPDSRSVYISEFGNRHDVPVLDRRGLQPDKSVEGPVIIEQYDSTSFVLPGQAAMVDNSGMLVIKEMAAPMKRGEADHEG